MYTILSDDSQEIAVQKASQMAVSTGFILWLIFLCKYRIAPRGVIYWLPTGDDVNDFVDTKVDPLINENAELGASVRADTKDPFNKKLKIIYGIPTFWRGLKSKGKVKSISADADVFDEFDESEMGQVSQAEKRTSASEVKLRRRLSTPTIPDFGINAVFNKTDQCHFALRCTSCSTWNIVEENFRLGISFCFQRYKDGRAFLACKHCKKPLDIRAGQWVKKYQGRPRGYQISQLYSPFVTPDELIDEFQTTEFIGHFWNHRIGLPYISSTDKVDAEQVLALCDPQRLATPRTNEPTTMGIDQGKLLHIVILSLKERNKILWVGERKKFEDIDGLMKAFSVRRLVIDALPETRKARELYERNSRKVFLCFYNDNQKGDYAWNEETGQVTVNRTESLDAGTDRFIGGHFSLPQRSKDIEEFAKHCGNIVKTTVQDEKTRAKRYVYVATGPDHYRHALNYAQIAAEDLKSGGVASYYRT